MNIDSYNVITIVKVTENIVIIVRASSSINNKQQYKSQLLNAITIHNSINWPYDPGIIFSLDLLFLYINARPPLIIVINKLAIIISPFDVNPIILIRVVSHKVQLISNKYSNLIILLVFGVSVLTPACAPAAPTCGLDAPTCGLEVPNCRPVFIVMLVGCIGDIGVVGVVGAIDAADCIGDN